MNYNKRGSEDKMMSEEWPVQPEGAIPPEETRPESGQETTEDTKREKEPDITLHPPEPEPEIKLHPQERKEAQPDLTAKITLPAKVRREIHDYVSPQWSNWHRALSQLDFEQRVDMKRAEQGLPPINPGRKHRDREVMQQNYEYFNGIMRGYSDVLSRGGELVPKQLIEFLDWRIGHKQGHVDGAETETNRKKNQKKLDRLLGWKEKI